MAYKAVEELGNLDAELVRFCTEYETFLTLWKDADPDLPVLLAAKAELARLR